MPFILVRPRARFAVASLVALGATALTVTLAFTLLAAPAAHANEQRQLSIMMDDDQVVYAPEPQRLRVLQRMKSIGVDLVRATVLWSVAAQGTKSPRTHHRFDPTNPADYPSSNWTRYDQLVRDAASVGISVYFNITGPGPPWAMGKTNDATLKKSFMPDAGQFGKFVAAVGKRYSGSYHGLPAMRIWSIWNEPNWPGWLAPQNVFSPKLHATVPYAPILYRRLFYAARRGLDRTGHLRDIVMMGETQPLGSNPENARTPMRPGLFIRELFCVDGHLRPYRGAQAAARGCGFWKGRGPIPAAIFAHHPYTKSAPPHWTDRNADAITLGDIGRLPKLLDEIAARTHRIAANLPIFITEMGYSTNPPNPFRGVPLATQAAYINESDYLAFRQPRVYSMTQFLYRDSPPVKKFKPGSRGYWSTFQTGITFANGKLKPSYGAYVLPIWVRSGQGSSGQAMIELWAQVRFRKGAQPSDTVQFQFAPAGTQTWTNVGSTLPLSNPSGFVDLVVPRAPYAQRGMFRAVWRGPVAPNIALSRNVAFP
jgi:hypothetical protein